MIFSPRSRACRSRDERGLRCTTASHSRASGESRISSAKNRHTDFRYWLIQFGTNNASRAVPNGKGLIPDDAGYSGSFKDSVQRIIDRLKRSNKVPMLANVPFRRNASASQDQSIREYNIVIDELMVANDTAVTPPNFYTYFSQHLQQFSDDLHPNAAGFQATVEL